MAPGDLLARFANRGVRKRDSGVRQSSFEGKRSGWMSKNLTSCRERLLMGPLSDFARCGGFGFRD